MRDLQARLVLTANARTVNVPGSKVTSSSDIMQATYTTVDAEFQRVPCGMSHTGISVSACMVGV